jgi:AmmeMemoRadiSam system protein B
LVEELERCLGSNGTRRPALACVVPHAGYLYSGPVAGAVYRQLEVPPVAIILGPNHAGIGLPLAILSEGEWETPLGTVAIDSETARALREACPALEEDALAHRRENSLAVQLPFLQHLREDIRIVPITLSVGDFEPLERLGEALASVVAKTEPRALLVASTDMNHYESEAVGKVKDRKALDAIEALEADRLYRTVRREGISMCGYEPTTATLIAARQLGAQTAELVRYGNSGDVTGDRSSVVGYAGLIIR